MCMFALSGMDPGFGEEQSASLLLTTTPESVAASCSGGLGRRGCPPTHGFLSAVQRSAVTLLWESSQASAAGGGFCGCGWCRLIQ